MREVCGIADGDGLLLDYEPCIQLNRGGTAEQSKRLEEPLAG